MPAHAASYSALVRPANEKAYDYLVPTYAKQQVSMAAVTLN